ncbi:DEAD/DEAH box helicase [Polaribacter pectinis]|uniref:DEAD/DEAH box helicase n=1 Tax=Polaribacter pectinis TaxID=2738844 RepID=A0A7G9L8F5_9FLAO|nr:DEAD/DEAH box helicase [Polaribacter pectinis]QNM84904.1 DEAD/DEAH box helicase [Polaribacter pectinis]
MINKIIEEIEFSENLNGDETFEIYKECSILILENRHLAEKLIINILNNKDKFDSKFEEILTDLVESVGFYPYLEKESLVPTTTDALIRKNYYHSDYLNKYFHEEQKYLLSLLESEKNIIVSAPTSFGKSLLFEEIISSNKYSNIIIIQPTLALLDETRKKLLKYNNDYKIIVRTSQEPSTEKGNIFLFTAERVNEYNQFPKIDFFVIDEFYKLSGQRDDERSSSLNNAFYYILKKYNPKFYLLGPNIDGISEGFEQKYNATFHRSDYSLVDSKEINIYENHKDKFGVRGKKADFKEEVLFELLYELRDQQTIIYCSSPNRVRGVSKKFSIYLKEKNVPKSEVNYPLKEWIEEYITKGWSLLKCLNYDIGIHDGALQKHITTSIIDYFNEDKLKYLFCTSTIIEGVNTSAKNIIYFDSTKGGRDIDYFDYSNIKGRAGRMMVHFVGNVYNFNPPPIKKQIIIDIPFYQQNPIKDEVLIQIDKSEVKNKNSTQFKAIDSIPEGEKNIIMRNGVKVQGQRNIFDTLRSDIDDNYELISWDNFPKYEQLKYIFDLAWDNLIVEGETTRPMTAKRLTFMTFNYGLEQNINQLINSNFSYIRNLSSNRNKSDNDLMDIAIQGVFQILKHWFQYKVPKWLSVINEIQKFVCEERGLRAGNYSFYSNHIENDFLPENLSILSEYGIPRSAIKKLGVNIPKDLNQDLILEFIKENKLHLSKSLMKYEKNKVLNNL